MPTNIPKITIEITESQANAILRALERNKSSIWDDPSAYDLKNKQSVIQKYIDKNHDAITKQIEAILAHEL